MYQADLVSPHRELSDGGLGFVIALLVRQEILFSFVSMDIAPPPNESTIPLLLNFFICFVRCQCQV